MRKKIGAQKGTQNGDLIVSIICLVVIALFTADVLAGWYL